MNLLLLVSWPYIRKHLLRYGLLVAGVALGVGFAVAMLGGTRSVVSGFRETIEQLAGSCQLQVSAGEAGVPEALLEKLQKLPQVRAASPVIEALTEVEQAGGSRILIVGVDMTGDAQMRPWLFHSGETNDGAETEVDPITFLAQPDSILLSRAFAGRHGWRIGSRLTLRTAGGPKTFTVRGLLADDNLDRVYGGNLAVMDVYGAQRVFGRGASVDRIDIALEEDTPFEDGRAAIRRVVGAGYSIDPPAARGEQFEDLLNAYRSLQIMVSLFAVALGVSMIDAAFALAVTERRTEIGILRCLGASRRQVQAVFMLEGLGTGTLGSVLGLALGAGLFAVIGKAGEGLFRGAFGGLAEQTYEFRMAPWVVALALAVGAGISLLASWLPARQAANLRPVEAFRPMHFQQGLQPWQPGALILAALLGCGALAGTLQQRSPLLFYASIVMLYLAAVVAMPSFLVAVVRLLRPLLARLLGVEGGLALDSLARTPRKTVTTIAALVLVFTQTVVVGGVNRSGLRTVERWIHGTFHADLLLSSSAKLESQSIRFPPDMDEVLRSVPGVALVQPVRSVRVPYRGQPVMLIASDYSLSMRKEPHHVVSGDWRDMCRRTARGDGVFISETMGMRERLRMGSTVELVAPGGTLRLPVVGMVNDYSDKRGVIFLSLALYRRYWDDRTLDKFCIDGTPGMPVNELRARLRQALGDRYPVSMVTQDEARDYIRHPPGRKLTPLNLQLLLSIAVGALALMNMASISIAERSREFALLRSLGGYRRQVRKTLLIELLATGGIAVLAGLLLGAILIVCLLAAVYRYVNGVRLDYFFPWDAALQLAGVALLAGVVAVSAVTPALARVPLSVAVDRE